MFRMRYRLQWFGAEKPFPPTRCRAAMGLADHLQLAAFQVEGSPLTVARRERLSGDWHLLPLMCPPASQLFWATSEDRSAQLLLLSDTGKILCYRTSWPYALETLAPLPEFETFCVERSFDQIQLERVGVEWLLFAREAGADRLWLFRYDLDRGRWTDVPEPLLRGDGFQRPHLLSLVASPRGTLTMLYAFAGRDQVRELCLAWTEDGGHQWQIQDGRALQMPISLRQSDVIHRPEPGLSLKISLIGGLSANESPLFFIPRFDADDQSLRIEKLLLKEGHWTSETLSPVEGSGEGLSGLFFGDGRQLFWTAAPKGITFYLPTEEPGRFETRFFAECGWNGPVVWDRELWRRENRFEMLVRDTDPSHPRLGTLECEF